MEYRVLTEKDLTQCALLFMDVFNKAPWNDDWSLEQATNYVQDIFNTPGFKGVGYFQNETCQGALLGNTKQWYSGKEFFIQEMFIGLEKQGKGIGKMLMTVLMNLLKEENIEEVALLTDRGIDAEYFYKKVGFNEIERLVFLAKSVE
ncbi:GNAT family N-acetyltransferase [Marinilactibacillus sp. GCM10026970]|uniref:GNAT family N-acetyltransferase n=1 Tax=Marinilactibacillus sp. GCM10026970 TaxID=3252642 RepID=UPI00360A951E